jgi:hypothetical protein
MPVSRITSERETSQIRSWSATHWNATPPLLRNDGECSSISLVRFLAGTEALLRITRLRKAVGPLAHRQQLLRVRHIPATVRWLDDCNGVEMTWRKPTVAYLKFIFRHLYGDGKLGKNTVIRVGTLHPRSEPRTSRVRWVTINHSPGSFGSRLSPRDKATWL